MEGNLSNIGDVLAKSAGRYKPKRLERGRFIWPSPATKKVSLSSAQLAMLLEGIDWRAPLRTWQPLVAG